jgi:sugar phosphate permease
LSAGLDPQRSSYGWVVLGIGFLAQASFAAVALGLPAIAPALRSTFDLSLAEIGLLLASLSVGTTLTLIPWGVATDRVGERRVLLVGLGGCGIFLGWASTAGGLWTVAPLLAVAGMLGAVASVASGRAVMTWFDPSRRGMALGVRQTAVPLGGALAALALPPLVAAAGVRWGLIALGIFCGAAGLVSLVWMRESPRSPVPHRAAAAPTRDRRIWRLSLGSALLVFSQISIVSFAVLFLHDARGMSATGAGAVLAAIQIAGAVARIAVGRWSDRLGSRVIPLSRVAIGIAVGWALVPLLFHLPLGLLVADSSSAEPRPSAGTVFRLRRRRSSRGPTEVVPPSVCSKPCCLQQRRPFRRCSAAWSRPRRGVFPSVPFL